MRSVVAGVLLRVCGRQEPEDRNPPPPPPRLVCTMFARAAHDFLRAASCLAAHLIALAARLAANLARATANAALVRLGRATRVARAVHLRG